MRYCDIYACDVANYLGCRVVLFVSGCTHHCKGCHNPITWDFKHGNEFDEETKERLVEMLSKPYIRGLTLSGGDPIDSYEDVLEFVKELKIRLPEKEICLYTGYTIEELQKSNRNEILDYIDVVIDGEYIEELRDVSLRFRGSSNQRIWRKDGNIFVLEEG